MRQLSKSVCLLVFCAFGVANALACSTIVVGRKASTTGCVLVGHNEDDDGLLYLHHGIVPRRQHPRGTMMPAEDGCARIPQVQETCSFYWSEVREPSGGLPNADSFFNENGVLLVSNNAGSSPPSDAEDTLSSGGLMYNLRRAVAERATSARHAVDVITNLVTVWGYAMPGRMYTVADSNEAWTVEIARGRRFVARRCPDDEVVVIPNCYTIRALEPGDIVSPGVARRAGRERDFDFAATFQGEGRMYRATDVLRFVHMYRIAAGCSFATNACPFSSRPTHLVSPGDVKAALSTHFEGSPDEMNPSHGGPYDTWVPVCRDSTVESSVCVFAGNIIKTELHVALGSPCTHPYRVFCPFGNGLPPDLDESADSAERLEQHVLPLSEKRGIDIGFLKDLLRMRTVSEDRLANNQCVEFMRNYLAGRGVHCHVIVNDKGRKALYAATSPGKSHDVYFVSHVDVVPPSDERQFQPFESGDWLYGRGSFDTKGNVAVICQVLVNLVGKTSIGAFFATDEDGKTEGGMPTPQLAIQEGFVPRKFVLVGDSASEVPNQLFVAEKGHAQFILRAKGKGGHSSHPWDLDNPIPKLLDGYARIQAAWPSPKTGGDHWYDTLSPTMMSGSDAGNMIPEVAEMRLSLRFTEMDGVARALSFMREVSGLEVVPPTHYRPPVISAPDDPCVRALYVSMCRKWTKDKVRIGRMAAATDATYFANFNLPIVIYGSTGKGAHAPDERVSLRSLSEYADLLTAHFLRNER